MKQKVSALWNVSAMSLLILLLLFAVGCESSDDGADSIPDGVIEAAEGILGDIVGSAVEQGESGSYPSGMTVSESGSTLTVDLTDFSPDGSVTLNGSIAITQVDSNTMTVVGTISISGHTYSLIEINASSYWSDPGNQEEPDSVSGTFTVDGTAYAMEDIMQRLQELE